MSVQHCLHSAPTPTQRQPPPELPSVAHQVECALAARPAGHDRSTPCKRCLRSRQVTGFSGGKQLRVGARQALRL